MTLMHNNWLGRKQFKTWIQKLIYCQKQMMTLFKVEFIFVDMMSQSSPCFHRQWYDNHLQLNITVVPYIYKMKEFVLWMSFLNSKLFSKLNLFRFACFICKNLRYHPLNHAWFWKWYQHVLRLRENQVYFGHKRLKSFVKLGF